MKTEARTGYDPISVFNEGFQYYKEEDDTEARRESKIGKNLIIGGEGNEGKEGNDEDERAKRTR